MYTNAPKKITAYEWNTEATTSGTIVLPRLIIKI